MRMTDVGLFRAPLRYDTIKLPLNRSVLSRVETQAPLIWRLFVLVFAYPVPLRLIPSSTPATPRFPIAFPDDRSSVSP